MYDRSARQQRLRASGLVFCATVLAAGSAFAAPGQSAGQPAGAAQADQGASPSGDTDRAGRASDMRGYASSSMTSKEGVRISAAAEAWQGAAELNEVLTPVRVRIENDSDQPVQVSYDAFSLVGGDGSTYATLPPLTAEMQVERADEPAAGNRRPGFVADRYRINRDYRHLYPHFPVVEMATWSPRYYDTYSREYEALDVPDSQEVVRHAIPEGVVEPGGIVSGFLYFQEVPDDASGVKLQARVMEAEGGKTVATLGVPLRQF